VRKIIFVSIYVIILLSQGCVSLLGPEDTGAIRIVFTSGRVCKMSYSTDNDSLLRKVRCLVKHKGIVRFSADLERDGDYFRANIANLEVGKDYSVWLYGSGSGSNFIVSGYASGIEIKKNSITVVSISWGKFIADLITPEYGAVSDTSLINFSWTKVPCATEYYLQVDNDSLFVTPSLSTQIDDTTFAWKATNKNTYYWRVVCLSDQGTGEWSETGKFKFDPNQ